MQTPARGRTGTYPGDFRGLTLALTKKTPHIIAMVEFVSGSGIDRILSRNEVQENEALRVRTDSAVAALDRRQELAEAAAARRPGIGGFSAGAGVDPEAGGDLRPADQPNRTPRLSDVLGDPAAANQLLEDGQGVDQAVSQADRLQQAALIDDAFRRSVFISMIDPGRAMTVLGTRQTIAMEDDRP